MQPTVKFRPKGTLKNSEGCGKRELGGNLDSLKVQAKLLAGEVLREKKTKKYLGKALL